jgi:hypothetical protein
MMAAAKRFFGTAYHPEAIHNLYLVHIFFGIPKVETNITCDDKTKHAWITARRTASSPLGV